jgi:uncharacterized protein YajQ (UPF0234 family)
MDALDQRDDRPLEQPCIRPVVTRQLTGKKKDDLQTAMALLRKVEMPIPLQFENFRD